MDYLMKLQSADKELGYAKAWLSLIGKPYSGGGGGLGKLRNVVFSADVYHQASNGAKNYHACPEGMRKAIAKAISRRIKEITAEAIESLELAKENAARDSIEEYRELLSEAGVAIPSEDQLKALSH